MKEIKLSLIGLLTLVMCACVTTTDSRFSKKADPDKAVESYVALGVNYLRQGDPVMARRKIERALEIDPQSAAAHNAMALLWQDRGEVELANQAFIEALKFDSGFSPANYHYGRFLMAVGRTKQACSYLRTAARDVDYGGRREAFEDLGFCYSINDDIKRAIDAYEKAWQQEGSSLIASLNLARLYVDQKRFDLASRWFRRFESVRSRGKANHTSSSLWVGLQIARVNKDKDAESAYAFQLKKSFPKSSEYKRYLESKYAF